MIDTGSIALVLLLGFALPPRIVLASIPKIPVKLLALLLPLIAQLFGDPGEPADGPLNVLLDFPFFGVHY